jgi:hypothetical protein
MNIIKKIVIPIIISAITLLLLNLAFAEKHPNEQEGNILSSGESIFNFMRTKEYASIWKVLSAKSKQIIADDVYSASKKAGEKYNKEEIISDFKSGGRLSKAYWDSFLSTFDPKMVLEDCQWEMGKIDRDEAEIILKHKKSENPAVLKMFKEESMWKFGWYESFGARRLNPF